MNLLVPAPITDITVTNIAGKPDKAGMFQVYGYRTADSRMRMVTFFVFRPEAVEVARGIHGGGEFIAEIDDKAWAYVGGMR